MHELRAVLRQQPWWQRASNRRLVRKIKRRLWPTPLLLPEYIAHRLRNRGRTFSFRGEDYRYFAHRYQVTALTERAVEVPLACKLLLATEPALILEVGNVLSHYFDIAHTVVDKYERGRHVVNCDVVDYRAPRQFELIVSISTLEHVGWDEAPREEWKWLCAVRHLRAMLAPGGILFATIPIGCNPHLDAALRSGVPEFDEIFAMRRITRDNQWEEAPVQEALSAAYGRPFPFANAIILAVARRDVRDQVWVPPL